MGGSGPGVAASQHWELADVVIEEVETDTVVGISINGIAFHTRAQSLDVGAIHRVDGELEQEHSPTSTAKSAVERKWLSLTMFCQAESR